MIDSALLKEVMLDNRREVMQHKVVSREIRIDGFGCYVLVGVRRSGKSYMLYGRIQQLIKEGRSWDDIIYLNFEDERLQDMEMGDLNKILEIHATMTEHRPMLFLDEVQTISGWEHFARRMADCKYNVVITGSNARMLSQDVASTLGGRYIIKEVYPFSFPEFLVCKGIDGKQESASTMGRANVKRLFEEYFTFGGFPEAAPLTSKRDYLTSLYQKLYLGDIALRHSIENVFALRVLFRKLAESVKQPVSFSRIANIVASTGTKVGKSTIINYMDYAQEAWLLLPLSNIADNITERTTNCKYYFIDNGILTLLSTDLNTALLENYVAVTLLRRYGRDNAVFFYKAGVEVDFYIPEEELAIQVCYNTLKDAETLQREAAALAKMSKQCPCRHLLVITYDEERMMEYGGLQIEIVPAWKWGLEYIENVDKNAIIVHGN